MESSIFIHENSSDRFKFWIPKWHLKHIDWLYSRERQKYNLLLYFSFPLITRNERIGRKTERMENGWMYTHAGAEVWFCGETSSAFLLCFRLSRDWYRTNSRHRIILDSPRFFTFASLEKSHLKSLKHSCFTLFLDIRQARTGPTQGSQRSLLLFAAQFLSHTGPSQGIEWS